MTQWVKKLATKSNNMSSIPLDPHGGRRKLTPASHPLTYTHTATCTHTLVHTHMHAHTLWCTHVHTPTPHT